LRHEFERHSDAERAVDMAAYMKDHFVFFGVPTPLRRAIQRPLLHSAVGWDAERLLDVAGACWAEPERELQYVGADLLRKHAAQLEPTDLPLVRVLLETRSWWDTIDTLAVHVVGVMVRGHRELREVMDDWIDDPNVWIARTAMLHQLGWKGATDRERLFRYAERQASNPDFFMRKSIGWALREYTRTDPAAVRRFVADHESTLSGLSRREALKRLERENGRS
jgi:3-methyladenine DNA glycosylase AlkD